MTRNQRRKLAAARKAEKDARIISAFISQKQEAIVRKNMVQPKPRDHSVGLVSTVYRGGHAPRAKAIGSGRTLSVRNENLPRKYR